MTTTTTRPGFSLVESAEPAPADSASSDSAMVAAFVAVMAVIARGRTGSGADDYVQSRTSWGQQADLPRSGWPARANGWRNVMYRSW